MRITVFKNKGKKLLLKDINLPIIRGFDYKFFQDTIGSDNILLFLFSLLL